MHVFICADAPILEGWRGKNGCGAHLSLNVIELLALCLDQHSHVQEDLVQVKQGLLQLPHCLMPLLDLCQRVQHLTMNIMQFASTPQFEQGMCSSTAEL